MGIFIRRFCSLQIIFLFVASSTFAVVGQEWSTPVNAQKLIPQIPANFKGGLFICDPYCEVLSVKRDSKWQPALENLMIKSTSIKLMSIKDPLFPILFPFKEEKKDEPQKIEEPEKPEEKVENNKKDGDGKDDNDLGPKPPRTAFDNGFRVPLLIGYDMLNVSSNNNIQAALNFSASSPYAYGGFDYFRAKPWRMLWSWWQLELGYEMGLQNGQYSMANGSSLTLSEKDIHLYLWQKHDKWSWSFRYANRSYQLSVPLNMISEYSMTENWTFVGMGLRYRRWEFYFDDGIGLNMSEQQSLRGQLTNFSGYQLGAQYCWHRAKLLRLIPLNNCLGGAYYQFVNSATINPLLGSGNVELDRTEMRLFWQINFGEDFLR